MSKTFHDSPYDNQRFEDSRLDIFSLDDDMVLDKVIALNPRSPVAGEYNSGSSQQELLERILYVGVKNVPNVNSVLTGKYQTPLRQPGYGL